MDSLKLLIKKLDSALQQYNPLNYVKLLSPLPSEKLLYHLAELSINEKDFELLYKWKNGIDFTKYESPRDRLFDFGMLLPLEEILNYKNGNFDYWDSKFVPLIATNDGDYLLFNNGRGKEHGRLHLYSPALLFIDKPISYYDSISTMIETTVKAYEQKILQFNFQENWLKKDFKAFRQLSKKINKNSDYWKLK